MSSGCRLCVRYLCACQAWLWRGPPHVREGSARAKAAVLTHDPAAAFLRTVLGGARYAPMADGPDGGATADDDLAPYDVLEPGGATDDAAAAPYSLDLRGHSVYVEACAYRSAKGKPCKHDATAGAGSSYCTNHTCQHPGCVEPKSSRARFCPIHTASSPASAAATDVYDQARDTEEGDAAATVAVAAGTPRYDSAPLESRPSIDRGLQPSALMAGYGGPDSVMNTVGARPRSNTQLSKGATGTEVDI